MKRITVSLPDELAAHVEREARRDRTSVSQVVRQSLTAKFGTTPEGGERHVPIAGLFASGHTDTAERHDEVLAETYERRHTARQADRRPILFASLGETGCPTLSEDVEDILRDEWGGRRDR